MLYEEFVKLAGYDVEYKTYKDVIEPMYNATNLNKQEFVACLNKKAFAVKSRKELISEMRKLMRKIEDYSVTNPFGYGLDDVVDKLRDIVNEYSMRYYGTKDWDALTASTNEWFGDRLEGRFYYGFTFFDKYGEYIEELDVLDWATEVKRHNKMQGVA